MHARPLSELAAIAADAETMNVPAVARKWDMSDSMVYHYLRRYRRLTQNKGDAMTKQTVGERVAKAFQGMGHAYYDELIELVNGELESQLAAALSERDNVGVLRAEIVRLQREVIAERESSTSLFVTMADEVEYARCLFKRANAEKRRYLQMAFEAGGRNVANAVYEKLDMVNSLMAQVRDLRAALERRQWNGYKGPKICEDCGSWENAGHTNQCATFQALATTPADPEGTDVLIDG